MKDAAEITNNMLKNNYTIEVSALRSHATATVSEQLQKNVSSHVSSKL